MNVWLEKLLQNESRDFWSEVKGDINYSVTNVIDDMHEASHMSNLFIQKYADLYNSVSCYTNDMNELVDNISDKIKYGCNRVNCYCNHNITYQNVIAAVGKIKEHKSDVNYCLNSDHVANG